MLEIRKVINKAIKEVYEKSYIDEAPDEAEQPYAVVTFIGGDVVEDQEVYTMDIDIWNNVNTIEIEQVSDIFWSLFRKFYHIDTKSQIKVERVARFTIEDPDPVIRRRKLTFTLKYFNRELI